MKEKKNRFPTHPFYFYFNLFFFSWAFDNSIKKIHKATRISSCVPFSRPGLRPRKIHYSGTTPRETSG